MITLVSDTETKPTPAMRKAMAEAEVGDEQRGEDPTVNRLLERVKELLGKEAALWLPTGTMCNLVAIRAHTRPGDLVIADHMAHIVRAESGGPAVASGVQIEQIETKAGTYTAGDLCDALDRANTAAYPYCAIPRLVCVEQTHNFCGGTVWTIGQLAEVASAAHEKGLAVHMDGARLLNAACASGTSAAEFCAHVDSVWIDFTKGLGAPIGAVLAGTKDFIEEARRQKHVFAGAMRQAGVVAAACLYALDHHVDRLKEDHENARLLAAGLAAIEGVDLMHPEPQSNIVFFDVRRAGMCNRDFTRAMLLQGVKIGYVRRMIRAVTHLDVTAQDIEFAVAAARRVLADPQRFAGTEGKLPLHEPSY